MTPKLWITKGQRLRCRAWINNGEKAFVRGRQVVGDGAEARWNRPGKQRISLRMDTEVVDWFKSKGPGYQTRINRILRRVMMEGKKRTGER